MKFPSFYLQSPLEGFWAPTPINSGATTTHPTDDDPPTIPVQPYLGVSAAAEKKAQRKTTPEAPVAVFKRSDGETNQDVLSAVVESQSSTSLAAISPIPCSFYTIVFNSGCSAFISMYVQFEEGPRVTRRPPRAARKKLPSVHSSFTKRNCSRSFGNVTTRKVRHKLKGQFA
jgi:hypothetical protein